MLAKTKTACLLLLLFTALLGQAQRYSVLIHEIMPDPEPATGLPNAEYIELKNASSKTIDLSGWRLLTSSSASGLFPAYLLQPDSLLVLTSRSNAFLFSPNTIGISSFPALPNDGTLLQLQNAAGSVVHAVKYESDWYQNRIKQEGGWSLEMIDALNPCSGAANWKAATAQAGGTPGKANSAAAANPDVAAPLLLSAVAEDEAHLLLRFNEPMDSSLLANTQHYLLTSGVGVLEAQPMSPFFDEVVLTLGASLQQGSIYTVAVNNIADCAGNVIGLHNSVNTGLPQMAQPTDVVINEILFNPKSDGSDYVELFNQSNKIIDLSGMWMGSNTGNSSLEKITDDPLYLFPGDYGVITEDRNAVLRNHLVKEDRLLIAVPRLPSLPDDKGSFVILNSQGIEIDKVSYAENWHFALIADAEGVALERIDPGKPAQDKENWTSAAATAGFGTPTYRNSQYRQASNVAATVTVSPKVLSPDNDGFDDFCTISFQLTTPNYVANLTIFDISGRKVRQLVHNQTLAQSGSWRWDGLGEGGQALASGTYVLLLELFNLQGKKQQFKMAATLARR